MSGESALFGCFLHVIMFLRFNYNRSTHLVMVYGNIYFSFVLLFICNIKSTLDLLFQLFKYFQPKRFKRRETNMFFDRNA